MARRLHLPPRLVATASAAFADWKIEAGLIGDVRRCSWSPPRSAFAGFRFPVEVILVAVRWYPRYGLSYAGVEKLLG